MPDRTRERQVCLRLTNEEYALFETRCNESGMSKTDFLVSVLKNSTIKVYRIDEPFHAMMKELRYIGSNINQLAYFSNVGQEQIVRENIESIRKKHNRLMAEISEFLKAPRYSVDVR